MFYKIKGLIKDLLRPSWWWLKSVLNIFVLFGARSYFRLYPSTSLMDKDSLYPPSELCRSTKHWMAMSGEKFGATFIPLEPACTVPNALPKSPHSRIRRQFTIDLNYDWPETFVVTIANARVWGAGNIITPDQQLLDDVSYDFRAQRFSLFPKTSSVVRYWRWQDPAWYDGRVAVLSTDGADIYYHWLFQLLPRFELMRRAGISADSIDYFVVNDLTKSFQRESMQALGIDGGKLIASSKVPYLKARQLIVPSIPLSGGCYPAWMCQFLRSTFLKNASTASTGTGRRLYISRGLATYRRVLNEVDVVQLLGRHGFEMIKFEGLSMREQAEIMASSEAVVAPHGGGLSNLVFCRPGTKVIEIFSPELVAGYFWKLCNELKLDYYYILGEGPPETQDDSYQQSWNARADIVVDLSSLRQALEMAGLE
jgi:capsular polysaccharide biosynthesis protein